MDAARKRSVSPPRTRHYKRMILLDEKKDDWRRTSSPSISITSKNSSDSEAIGKDLNLVTEKFSGFLADFLAEYGTPNSPRSLASTPELAPRASQDAALPTTEPRGLSDAPSQVADSPGPGSYRSESPSVASEYTSSSERDEGDASTIADGESNWEDDEVDTPGSPGSDIELHDSFMRRGMYITVVLTDHERSKALPCTAKVLEVHDRRGKFTMRLSKSARRAARATFAAGRSPGTARGRYASPRP